MLYGEPQTSQVEMINLLKIESDKKNLDPFHLSYKNSLNQVLLSKNYIENSRQTFYFLLLLLWNYLTNNPNNGIPPNYYFLQLVCDVVS